MRALILASGTILLMLTEPADAARWRWPWDPGYRHASHRRHRAPRLESDKPNCRMINEGVLALPPAELKRARGLSNKHQIKTIDGCAKERAP